MQAVSTQFCAGARRFECGQGREADGAAGELFVLTDASGNCQE
jgi:hypothetical protein